MRAPKVRNAKQRGKQYNSNLAQGSPTRNAVKYYRGLRVYFDGKKMLFCNLFWGILLLFSYY